MGETEVERETGHTGALPWSHIGQKALYTVSDFGLSEFVCLVCVTSVSRSREVCLLPWSQ